MVPRIGRIASLSFGGLVLGLLAYLTMAAWNNPVPSGARDLDCDGSVSVSEWYSAGLDHGWRPASDGTKHCMEVFSLKDGLPVVCMCERAPRCRTARKDMYSANCLTPSVRR